MIDTRERDDLMSQTGLAKCRARSGAGRIQPRIELRIDAEYGRRPGARKVAVLGKRAVEGNGGRQATLARGEQEPRHAAAENARRQARELLTEAKLEAERIVDAAGRARTQHENELAQQRAVFEESRARLSGFLADVLEEVDSGPGASEGAANGRDLDEALGATAPAGGDR